MFKPFYRINSSYPIKCSIIISVFKYDIYINRWPFLFYRNPSLAQIQLLLQNHCAYLSNSSLSTPFTFANFSESEYSSFACLIVFILFIYFLIFRMVNRQGKCNHIIAVYNFPTLVVSLEHQVTTTK